VIVSRRFEIIVPGRHTTVTYDLYGALPNSVEELYENLSDESPISSTNAAFRGWCAEPMFIIQRSGHRTVWKSELTIDHEGMLIEARAHDYALSNRLGLVG